LRAKRKKRPGPKDISAIARPVAMPSKVRGGAQHSSLCLETIWLGTATISSRMLPRRSQRVMVELKRFGSSLEKLRENIIPPC
jgi:hypothetical protein